MVADLARAESLLELRRPGEAETELRQLLAADPSSGRVLRLLVLALLHQDRNDEAEEIAHRAVAADPTDEHGYRLVSVASVRTNKVDQARATAQAAVHLAPGMWATHYTLGMALRAGRRPRTRDALDCANQAVRLAPHESAAHNLAGICLDELRLHAEARRAFAEALRLDPHSDSAMGNLTATQISDGKLVSATSMLASALSVAPQATQLHRTYDSLLYRLLLRVSIALVVLGVLLFGLTDDSVPSLVRGVTLAVGLAVCAALTSRILSRLPRGVRHWVRGLVRRGTFVQGIVVTAFLLLLLGTIGLGLAPRDAADSIATGVILGLEVLTLGLFVAAGIDWFIAFRRDKRSQR